MSTQAPVVPLGYASQDAIAPPVSTIIMGPDPNFSLVVAFIEEGLHEHYDRLAEEDLELLLAGMQFPS